MRISVPTDRRSKLTEEVLKRTGMMVSENTEAILEASVQQDRESSRNSLHLIQCVVSEILLMHKDDTVRKILSPLFKSEVDLILHNIITLQVDHFILSSNSTLYILQIHVAD